jgi:hypothetical protein
MINDATDVVCSADTPLKDLRLRCNLQNNLWNNVLALRGGKFFDCVGNDFFAAIDDCKISMYDTPDLLYIGDEGIILKRLLAAFSFRPLVISTNPIFGTYGTANPINFPVISNRVIASSLLTLRLPTSTTSKVVDITLSSALTQSQVYLENGMFVPKTQDVIYTKGVIIFHVPRRTISPNKTYQNLISPIPTFDQIPSHILRNERVNDTPIEVEEVMTISQSVYYLRSAIFLETNYENGHPPVPYAKGTGLNQIVTSTAALIVQRNNPISCEYLCYSPKTVNLGKISVTPVLDTLTAGDPVSDNDPLALLAQKATIFIYSNDTDIFNTP